jgi:hypothetical protein
MASESGHWYAKDGTPTYRIVGTNGKERNTTLRDARKMDLVPSVTTILNVAAKPGLNNWIQQQVLLAALTLPRADGEPEEAWIDRIMQDSKSVTQEAADRGTAMHSQIESYFEKRPGDYPDYVKETYFAVVKEFGNQDWRPEKSFAHPSGFGGKVDLHGDNVVIDFKTKEKVDEKTTVYEEHVMQLAAYREGLGMPNAACANVFVDQKGNVKIITHPEEDLKKGWEMFQTLLKFYQIKNDL